MPLVFCLGLAIAVSSCSILLDRETQSSPPSSENRLVIQSSNQNSLSDLFKNPAFLEQLLPPKEYGQVKVVSVPPGSGASNESRIVVVKRKITRRVYSENYPATLPEPAITAPVEIAAQAPQQIKPTRISPSEPPPLAQVSSASNRPTVLEAKTSHAASSPPKPVTQAKLAKASESVAAASNRATVQPESHSVPTPKPPAKQQDIAKAKAQTTPVSLNGLKQKSANWPLPIKPANVFGAKSPEGSAWIGLVFKSKSGEPVKAVEDGRIVFAQNLRGYGNLIIVDHGRQYTSIYGYNSALTKNVGDTVRAGDTIAMTGNTGPITDEGMYFEIRKEGIPINPMLYLK